MNYDCLRPEPSRAIDRLAGPPLGSLALMFCLGKGMKTVDLVFIARQRTIVNQACNRQRVIRYEAVNSLQQRTPDPWAKLNFTEAQIEDLLQHCVAAYVPRRVPAGGER